MAKVFIEESSLTAIGNAIRAKTGGTGTLTVPNGMVEAIGTINADYSVTASPSNENQIIAITDTELRAGIDVTKKVSKLTYNGTSLDIGSSSTGAGWAVQDLTITENGVYTAPHWNDESSDVVGWRTVTVNVTNADGTEDESIDALIDRTITGAYSNSRVESIGVYAFMACNSLTYADFPNVTIIKPYAFQSTTNLTAINFPKLQHIQCNAFCSSGLTSADFPCVNTIEAGAFSSCSSLTRVILRVNEVCSLEDTNAFPDGCTIYVPDDLLASYKDATRWRNYLDGKIKPISEIETETPEEPDTPEIPEDAEQVSVAVGGTYSKRLYDEFHEYNLTLNTVQVEVSDSTVVNARCEENDEWEPYLKITGLKAGEVLVELPQIEYVYHVIVSDAPDSGGDDDEPITYDYTVDEFGEFYIPIESGDTVEILSEPSFINCTVAYDEGYIYCVDRGNGSEMTGTIKIESALNGTQTYTVKANY